MFHFDVLSVARGVTDPLIGSGALLGRFFIDWGMIPGGTRCQRKALPPEKLDDAYEPACIHPEHELHWERTSLCHGEPHGIETPNGERRYSSDKQQPQWPGFAKTQKSRDCTTDGDDCHAYETENRDGNHLLPNVQDEPRPCLARSVLLGARDVTAMVVGSGALLALFLFNGQVYDCFANRCTDQEVARNSAHICAQLYAVMHAERPDLLVLSVKVNLRVGNAKAVTLRGIGTALKNAGQTFEPRLISKRHFIFPRRRIELDNDGVRLLDNVG
jgi:hypothetical protein